jgi:hypothetical protein
MIQKEKSEEEKVKNLENVSKSICYVIFLYCLQSFAYAETKDVRKSAEPSIKWANLESVIKGEYLKVILAVYDDFSKDVNATKEKKEESLDTNSYRSYLTKLENYDILVYKESSEYLVRFILRNTEKYPIFSGDGGITEYEVNLKTYQVTKLNRGK